MGSIMIINKSQNKGNEVYQCAISPLRSDECVSMASTMELNSGNTKIIYVDAYIGEMIVSLRSNASKPKNKD